MADMAPKTFILKQILKISTNENKKSIISIYDERRKKMFQENRS